MNRLQSEFSRLYLPEGATDAERLIDPRGATRALVLEVASAVGWEPFARAWRSVQAELGLPAPAVAVNGRDAFQLWFSLVAPVGLPEAHAFLEGLRRRFLGEAPPQLVRSLPLPDEGEAHAHARPVPEEQAQPGTWSAFVKPELVAVFADTPWLDVVPGVDGQADLLAGLESIDPEMYETASARIGASAGRVPIGAAAGIASDASSLSREDPQAFLLRVMRDETAPLALRVEAAKALLARGPGSGAG